jgi:hypothetical protein
MPLMSYVGRRGAGALNGGRILGIMVFFLNDQFLRREPRLLG